MSNVYFISDSHFNHFNVITYENRPFNNIIDMNECMIERWNSVVKSKSDKVFFCGDFGFGGRDNIAKIVKQLRGNKVLIMGNHDKRRSYKFWLDVGFKEVYSYPIIYNTHFILSHQPLLSVPNGYLNVHGHIHSKTLFAPYHFNVSCEVLNYYPINFNEIRDMHYGRRPVWDQ
jgi:calcineurin-like phosphoesterase family protein